MNNSIRIGSVDIHVDENGRYCLNDLHRASGGRQKDAPRYWLKNKRTMGLITIISSGNPLVEPLKIVNGGPARGTYVSKELVFAYGMWVSVEFYHHVIQVYDFFIMTEHDKLERSQERLKRAIVKDPNCLSIIFKERRNNVTHALFKAMESLGLVRIITEFRPVYKKEITESGWRYCSGYSKDGVIRVKPEMHRELISLVRKSLDGCNMEVFE